MYNYTSFETLQTRTNYIKLGNQIQQTRAVDPMLFECWASLADGGPTLKQHKVNVSCLMGKKHHV